MTTFFATFHKWTFRPYYNLNPVIRLSEFKNTASGIAGARQPFALDIPPTREISGLFRPPLSYCRYIIPPRTHANHVPRELHIKVFHMPSEPTWIDVSRSTRLFEARIRAITPSDPASLWLSLTLWMDQTDCIPSCNPARRKFASGPPVADFKSSYDSYTVRYSSNIFVHFRLSGAKREAVVNLILQYALDSWTGIPRSSTVPTLPERPVPSYCVDLHDWDSLMSPITQPRCVWQQRWRWRRGRAFNTPL